MKKQTAVEWLASYIKGITDLNCDEIIEQAKQIEKEQIEDAWSNGYDEDDRATSSPLKFYAETYGGNNSEITMNNQSSTFPYVCASCNKEMVAGGFPKWFCLHTTCKNYLKPITK